MIEKEQLISKLSDLERFCLIGYIYTKDATSAYIASRGKKLTASPKSLTVQVSRWLNSPEVQAFIEVERSRRFAAISLESVDTDNRSKDDVIRDLNILATQESEPRRKSEILMKIADLQQMKKQEESDKESLVKYFMPLKCNQCVLYKNAKEKHEQKNK